MTLSLEDRLDIVELAARYCHALDSGDVDAVVATFAPDGISVVPRATFTGQEQLTAFFKANVEVDYSERHFTSNHLVEGDGRSATHTCYYQVAWRENQGTKATGIYRDSVVKTEDGWRFESRRVEPDRSRSRPRVGTCD